MSHPKIAEARRAAKALSPADARTMLETYIEIHDMRRVVGWWSQAGEAAFKRALGEKAGILKNRGRQ